MAVSENAKRTIVHIFRGLAYIAFPIGVFLFALFILSASQNDLDFTTFGNDLLNILAFLLFFIPPAIILFLHPPQKNKIVNAEINTNSTTTFGTKNYMPHIAIIAILAVIVLVPFLYVLTFIVVTFGFG